MCRSRPTARVASPPETRASRLHTPARCRVRRSRRSRQARARPGRHQDRIPVRAETPHVQGPPTHSCRRAHASDTNTCWSRPASDRPPRRSATRMRRAPGSAQSGWQRSRAGWTTAAPGVHAEPSCARPRVPPVPCPRTHMSLDTHPEGRSDVRVRPHGWPRSSRQRPKRTARDIQRRPGLRLPRCCARWDPRSPSRVRLPPGTRARRRRAAAAPAERSRRTKRR